MTLDHDLSIRVDRLLRGARRTDDLDRLFLGLRDRSAARPSVREIGDVVAHRDQREKGLVTQKARDIFTSFRSWFRISVKREPFSLGDIRTAAEANLRNATDAQLMERLGLKRAEAKAVLIQACKRLEKGIEATAREKRVFDYLGSAFIWNPVFTDTEVLDDLQSVLNEVGLLRKGDREAFRAVHDFLALYVVTLIHGSKVVLDGGDRADLLAGYDNPERRLEVKVMLTSHDLGPKPVYLPACMFWTTLIAGEHCAPQLMIDATLWQAPLEVAPSGKLAPLI